MLKSVVRFTMVSAFVAMLAAALVIVPVAAQLSQAADEVLVLDQNEQALISGVVSDLDDDSFVLISDGRRVNVDLENINAEDWPKGLIENGMRVSVAGKFHDDEIRATRVSKLDEPNPAISAEAAAEVQKRENRE